MERATWTDERLDDLSARVDRNLELVLEEIRLLRGDIAALQRQIAQIGWALAGTLIAAMTALVVSLS